MTISKPSIRRASAADIPKIADFNRALCRETEYKELDAATVLKGVERFISEGKRGQYFVAERENVVVGQCAYTYEWSDWRNGEIWWIQSVYIHPHHRGHGVFRSLFSHIESLGMEDPDCCGIRLYMEKDNHAARKAYLKLGFKDPGYEVFEKLFQSPAHQVRQAPKG